MNKKNKVKLIPSSNSLPVEEGCHITNCIRVIILISAIKVTANISYFSGLAYISNNFSFSSGTECTQREPFFFFFLSISYLTDTGEIIPHEGWATVSQYSCLHIVGKYRDQKLLIVILNNRKQTNKQRKVGLLKGLHDFVRNVPVIFNGFSPLRHKRLRLCSDITLH